MKYNFIYQLKSGRIIETEIEADTLTGGIERTFNGKHIEVYPIGSKNLLVIMTKEIETIEIKEMVDESV